MHRVSRLLLLAALGIGALASLLLAQPPLHPSLGHGEVYPGTLLHSGELTLEAVDLRLAGRGFDLVFARTYRNQTVGFGPLGLGWTHGWEQSLHALSNGDVDYFDGRGLRHRFRRQSDGSLRSPPGVFLALEPYSNGWTLIEPNGTTARFGIWGQLVSMADAARVKVGTGNEMSFVYDAHDRLVEVVDSLGRRLRLSYDEHSLLVAVRDSTGREVRYGYDADGRLVSVSYPGGPVWRYGYVEPPRTDATARLHERDNLTSITDALGQKVLEVVYGPDSQGHADAVVEQRWGGGTARITYDFGAGTATVTDRRGATHTYEHNAPGQATRYVDPSGAVWRWEYEPVEGRLVRLVRPLGGVVELAYPAQGSRRSLGNVERITVRPDGRGENGSGPEQVTTIEYDGMLNLPMKVVEPSGKVTEFWRSREGWLLELKEAVGRPEERVTRTTWFAEGVPSSVTDPLGRWIEFAYFTEGPSNGHLREVVVDPAGLKLTTRFEVDARGNVTAVIDPRGVRSEFVWNELDWLMEERRAVTGAGPEAPALGYRTAWVRDANGRVIEERRPFGDGAAQTAVRYSRGTQGEILAIERELAPGGEVIREHFAYDAALALVRHTDGEGTVRELVRDARGLVSELRQGVGALAEPEVERFGYDAERQLRGLTDARGYLWQSLYDGYGRPRESRDPLGNRSEQLYDTAGRPSQRRWLDAVGELLAQETLGYDLFSRPASRSRWLLGETPRELRESYGWNAADELVTLTDVLGRVSLWERDSARRVIASQDALGNRSELGLDAAGNVVSLREVEQVPGGGAEARTTLLAHDALSRQVRREDALGNVERWTWDALGELSSYVDAEGNTTLREVDALGRLTRLTRPEGLEEVFGWDRASRLASYADAQGHTTRWLRDVLGRVERLELPDGGAYVYERDPAGNPTKITDPNGSQIAQVFDERGLLTRRESTLAAGILGPMLETFAHDGLGRLSMATLGDVTTQLSWDALSRLLSEETLGRRVEHPRDDAGNPVELAYPSGLRLKQGFDALNRLEQLGRQTATGLEPWAGYTFRGMDRVHQQALSAQLRSEQGYDTAGRPTRTQVGLLAGGRHPFDEQQTWSPRGLKTSTARLDQNGEGWLLGHDGASRLLEAATSGSNPNRWSFAYDEVDNLVRREQDVPRTSVELPPDASGRNRPASVGGVALVWDANGNLIAKGDKRFAYDVHNRLTKVSTATGTEIVSYVYDALGRRVKKVFPDGTTLETAYSGWRELEEYKNGQLSTRQTFGLGLDEIVRLELDQDGDGQLEQALVPVYDGAGNLAMLLTLDGRVAGKYSYSPFGDVLKNRVDNVPPQVEQLRLENPAGGPLRIEIDFGEQVDGLHFQTGVSDGKVIARPVPVPQSATKQMTSSQSLVLEAHQPIQDGRRARRRVIVTATDPPEAGTELELVLDPAAVADLFGNALAEPFELRLTVPAAGAAAEVLLDTNHPRVDEILLRDGYLEVSFTERPDPASAAAALRIAGAVVGWELLGESYTLRSTAPLAAGAHVVRVEPDVALDLAGKGLEQAFEQGFTVDGVQPIAAIFEAPDPRVVPLETLANRFTFQGRPYDPETGFFYFRNRQYDPELGRFITADPLGNFDGPSRYAFAGYSPFDFRDPVGLACRTPSGGVNVLCNPLDEIQLSSATPLWKYSLAVAAETGGNSVTELLFLNVFADSPHVVLDPDASGGERVVAGGKAAGALFLNLGGAGAVVKAGAGRLVATRPVQWLAKRLGGSRVGQRVGGVLLEDVEVLWHRVFGQVDEVAEEVTVNIIPAGSRGTLPVRAADEVFEQALFAEAIGTAPEVVHGFRIFGNKGIVGSSFQRNIFLLEAEQIGARSPRALLTAFEAEAKAAGATELRIVEHAVGNPSLLRPGLAQKLGYSFRQINDMTIELVKLLR